MAVIEPARGLGLNSISLRELWEYRELLGFLVWRDVKVRYRQTVLGAAWAIIQPLATMLIFVLFFHNLAKVPSDGNIPYPIFSYAGLLPWQFFASGLTQAANSLLNSSALIRKVYFPRVLVPVASSLGSLVDFAFAFLVLIGLMFYYQLVPTLAVLLLPVFLLMALATVIGVGLWLSALSVRYRDVRYIVSFLVQFWMFATPVVYPSALLHEPWRTIYGLNPMVGVVEGFRWALVGTQPPSAMILVSATVTLVVLVSGLIFFQRTERGFADVI
jgi:lipopolysaccharide transport system permease protein